MTQTLKQQIEEIAGALEGAVEDLTRVAKAELGVHAPGDTDPYYYSWNDGEYWVKMALHNNKEVLTKLPALLALAERADKVMEDLAQIKWIVARDIKSLIID